MDEMKPYMTPFPIEEPNNYLIASEIASLRRKLEVIEIKLNDFISILNRYIDLMWIRESK